MWLVFAVCNFYCVFSAGAGVCLTVNGLSGGLRQFDPNTPLYLGISDTSSTNTYDLTITATGGGYGDITDPNSPMIVNDNIVNIACSDVNDISTVEFQFDENRSFAMVSLATNSEITIGSKTVEPDSIIYQLVIFEQPETGQVVVFSITYETLSYQHPPQETEIIIPGQSIPVEPSYQWFDNPAHCPDLNNDNFVNMADFAIFAGHWGNTGIDITGDFGLDGIVDANDLCQIADYWLYEVETVNYHSDGLPYLTDFRNFDSNETINSQSGWQVSSGDAQIISDPNTLEKYVELTADSIISKSFTSNEDNDSYVRFKVSAAAGSQVNVKYDGTTFASVKFTAGKIDVLDDGVYQASSQDTQAGWQKFTLHIDFENSIYSVYYNGGCIYSNAAFSDTITTLDEIEFTNSTSEFKVSNLSITSETDGGGVLGNEGSIYITTPCACSDDELAGKVAVTGKVWWENMSLYRVHYWPVSEPQPQYINDWHIAFEGYNTVAEGGVLGYWDTNIIPDDYYYLAIIVYDIAGDNAVAGKIVTDFTYNNQPIGWMWKAYIVSSELKTNTFQKVEEPDISMDWPGMYPFEFRRVYNNNRRFYSRPLYNGWSYNYGHIRLTEYTSDDNCARSTGGFPRNDGNILGSGEIFVVYPDGSSSIFECRQPSNSQFTTVYEAKSKEKTGDIVKRTTDADLHEYPELFGYGSTAMAVYDVKYELILKDGTTIEFEIKNSGIADYAFGIWPYISVPGSSVAGGRTGWGVQARPKLLKDRFGNKLNFQWDNDGELAKIYCNDDTQRAIELTKDGSGYYTKAELKVGSQVYRTVEYDRAAEFEYRAIRNDGYSNLVKSYYYDGNYNLRAMSSQGDFDQPDIWIDYDNYGRVGVQMDFVQLYSPGFNFLETAYEYGVDLKNEIYTTIAKTDYAIAITRSNKDGGVISQRAITADGSKVKNIFAEYDDQNHPELPTTITEEFDGKERITENKYDYNGNLIEKRVYVDDERYVLTEYEYHAVYNLPIRQTSWRDYLVDDANGEPVKTGKRAETLNIYGNADGTADPDGAYMVQQRTLIDTVPGEPEDEDVWAVTEYTYHDDGQVKSKIVYQDYDTQNKQSLEIEFTSLDDYGYPAFKWVGLVPTPADPNSYVSGYQEKAQRRYLYNDIGQKILEADYLGMVRLYEYDMTGRLRFIVRFDDEHALSRSDFNLSTYSDDYLAFEAFVYDGRDNVILRRSDTDEIIATQYNLANKPYLRMFTNIDNYPYAYWRQESIVYDDRGLEIAVWTDFWNREDGQTYEECYDTTAVLSYYDGLGRLTDKYWFETNADIIDPNSPYLNASGVLKHTRSVYGGNDKPVRQELYGQNNVIERSVSIEHDILDRQRAVVIGGTRTEQHYDAAGNRVYVVNPAGNMIISDYDNAGRKVRDYFAAEAGYIDVLAHPEDPNDTSTVSVFDFETTRDAAAVKTELTYYDSGKVKSQTDYDYDESVLASKAYSYDTRGRIVEVAEDIDGTNAAVTGYAYSDEAVLGPVGDENYHIRVIAGEGKDTFTALNCYGKPYKVLHPDGSYEQYGYYTDGLLYSQRVWENGQPNTKRFFYDEFKNLIEESYGENDYVEYRYDGRNQKVQTLDYRTAGVGGYNTLWYKYDALGRLSWAVDQDWYVTDYHYRGDGQKNRITIRVDDQGQPVTIYDVSYMYDGEGRLKEVFDKTAGGLIDGWLGSLGYDANGNRSTEKLYLQQYPLGTYKQIDYTYNMDDMLTGINGDYYDFTGEIDGLGRIVSADETISATSRGLSYGYDRRSELTAVSMSNVSGSTWTGSYDHSEGGNLETRTEGGVQLDHSYTGDLLTGVGTETLVWDENGQMETGVGVSLDWNLWGHLASASTQSGGITCKYTPSGEMIHKSNPTNNKRYIYDTTGDYPVVLMIIDANDINACYSYFNAGSQPMAMKNQGGDYFYFIRDRLGSVRAIIDEAGTIKNQYTYDPWGNTLEIAETIPNHLRFANYHFDETTGLYYLNARWYDPAIQRFTGRDPVRGKFQEPLTLHAYLYCLNNPQNRVDPDGKWAMTIGGSVSGVLSSRLLSGVTKSKAADLIRGGLGIHALMRQALIGLVALEADMGLGMTGGASMAFGQDANGRAFFGSMYSIAGGGAVNNGSGTSLTLDIGFSPNAQSMQDLAGGFKEAGGSVTVPAFVGSLFSGMTIGGSYAVGKDGISLYTFSIGAGTIWMGTSWEAHGYIGHTIVQEW